MISKTEGYIIITFTVELDISNISNISDDNTAVVLDISNISDDNTAVVLNISNISDDNTAVVLDIPNISDDNTAVVSRLGILCLRCSATRGRDGADDKTVSPP